MPKIKPVISLSKRICLFLLDEKLGYHKKPTELFVGFSQNFSRRCPQKCPGNQMEIETMVPELDSPSIGLGTIEKSGYNL